MKINIEEVSIKRITKNDLVTLISWASNEGWNPGKNDLEVFWKTDPDGFYGCFHDGKLIAGGAIISYNQEFGFMGLFIVDKPYRKFGIGRKLWFARRNLLISRLKKDASIGMDGILAMQHFYQKGGFNIEFKDERYEFVGKKYPSIDWIKAVEPQDFDELARFDLKFFGFQRNTFLKEWLSMPESSAFKSVGTQGLLGYAVIRKAEKGFRIGPLFAENAEVAEELLKSCFSTAEGEPVFLDIPTINQGAVALVKKYNGKYVFECARMYYGKSPNSAVEKIYGITSFELG